MSAAIKLYNDILNNRLVLGLTSREPFQFGTLFEGAALPLKIFPVVPSGNVIGNLFTKVDISSLSLKVGIGPSTGAEARLAAQDVWAKQTVPDAAGDSGYLYATLELNTNAMETAIGSADSLASKFEIQIGENGVFRCTYQTPITIQAVVIGPDSGATLPDPASSYYTKADIDALLASVVRFAGNANGGTLTLASPSGGHLRILGVRDDGSAQDDLI